MSWLLLVSGSRERVNTNKSGFDDIKKSSGLILLSTAAKLRVLAERDLCEKESEMRAMLWREKLVHSFRANLGIELIH